MQILCLKQNGILAFIWLGVTESKWQTSFSVCEFIVKIHPSALIILFIKMSRYSIWPLVLCTVIYIKRSTGWHPLETGHRLGSWTWKKDPLKNRPVSKNRTARTEKVAICLRLFERYCWIHSFTHENYEYARPRFRANSVWKLCHKFLF